jgi:hypothetical protein
MAVNLAILPLHFVFGFRSGLGLPLHIPNLVGPTAGQRLYVIFHVAGAGTPCLPCRWARVLPLEFIKNSM